MGKSETLVRDALPLLSLMRSQRAEIWLKEGDKLPDLRRTLSRDQVMQLLADPHPPKEERALLDAVVLGLGGTSERISITAATA